jgi:hypothetical protein
MDFRRSGQLDERRRRMLMDELAQPADTENAETAPPGGGSAKGPVRAYGPAVLDQHQPRVTDLLPTRPLWTTAAILLAITAVAAIECIHIHIRTLPAAARASTQLAALDATARGSLDDWFSSLLLAGGAGLALLTFGIRRHRVDDYRGRYRLWLWTAAALAWASLDAGTHIHDALGLGIGHLAGQALLNGTPSAAVTISWLAIYGIVFGTLAIRLAIEVWQSLPALAALGLAVVGYLLSGVATLDMLPTSGPLIDSVVRTTILLLAHVGLVSAIGLYARHVALDATGRLKIHIDPDRNRKGAKGKSAKARLKVVSKDDSQIKKPQPAEKTESKPAAASGDKPAQSGGPLRFAMGSSASSQPPKAAAGISKATASAPQYDDDDEDEDEDSGDQRLSRAERRRLKKLARRDGQRRAA